MELESGKRYFFSDWPIEDIPAVASGVYTVFRGDQFIYVGMAGRGWTQADIEQRRAEGHRKGLWERLNSHASGRRSGDQFCVYICDRFVVPRLTDNERSALEIGSLSLDNHTRDLIREELSFRSSNANLAEPAIELERTVHTASLDIGKPLLNPIST